MQDERSIPVSLRHLVGGPIAVPTTGGGYVSTPLTAHALECHENQALDPLDVPRPYLDLTPVSEPWGLHVAGGTHKRFGMRAFPMTTAAGATRFMCRICECQRGRP